MRAACLEVADILSAETAAMETEPTFQNDLVGEVRWDIPAVLHGWKHHVQEMPGHIITSGEHTLPELISQYLK